MRSGAQFQLLAGEHSDGPRESQSPLGKGPPSRMQFIRGATAPVRYLDSDFQIVRPGDFVRCAVTGRAIRLEDLRYWSVERQEPYVSAEVGMQRHLEGVARD